MESFSICKKLHLETIGMANFSKWKYWSDSVFPYTMLQCGKHQNISPISGVHKAIRYILSNELYSFSYRLAQLLSEGTLVIKE